MNEKLLFNNVKSALEDFRAGKFVIVVDDESRENEGDLFMAAEKMTPEAINFMATHARGLICTPMDPATAKKFELPLMVENNSSFLHTAFTVSIDYKNGTSTGISAFDRYMTIKSLTDPKAKAQDFNRPGHIFPLIAKEGGILERDGHTEACVDMCKLTGLQPVGALCEIVNSDGTMARMDDLKQFARTYDIKLISISDLISYRQQLEESPINPSESIKFPTKWGDFQLQTFTQSNHFDDVHLLLEKKDQKGGQDIPLVRIHSECFTGDVLGSLRCDCQGQLEKSLELLSDSSHGLLFYMKQEGRGIGLAEKIKAYALQDQEDDTISANLKLGHENDLRTYENVVHILKNLKMSKIRLLTNNPQKVKALEKHGIEVERVSLEIPPTPHNISYLKTKKEKMGHELNHLNEYF